VTLSCGLAVRSGIAFALLGLLRAAAAAGEESALRSRLPTAVPERWTEENRIKFS